MRKMTDMFNVFESISYHTTAVSYKNYNVLRSRPRATSRPWLHTRQLASRSAVQRQGGAVVTTVKQRRYSYSALLSWYSIPVEELTAYHRRLPNVYSRRRVVCGLWSGVLVTVVVFFFRRMHSRTVTGPSAA